MGVCRDITQLVDLERRYRKEREYRDTLTSGAMSTYEVDLTEDTVKYLDATWVETLGMAKENGCSYSELVREAAEKVVSEEYREKMRQVFEPQSLLAAYQAGQRAGVRIPAHQPRGPDGMGALCGLSCCSGAGGAYWRIYLH